MKAKIAKDGHLWLIPENSTEYYAITMWVVNNSENNPPIGITELHEDDEDDCFKDSGLFYGCSGTLDDIRFEGKEIKK